MIRLDPFTGHPGKPPSVLTEGPNEVSPLHAILGYILKGYWSRYLDYRWRDPGLVKQSSLTHKSAVVLDSSSVPCVQSEIAIPLTLLYLLLIQLKESFLASLGPEPGWWTTGLCAGQTLLGMPVSTTRHAGRVYGVHVDNHP